VLQNVITPKFLHKKFIQKYEWIEHISIYHHSKFEVEQKLVQEETKKIERNLHMNSCGLRIIHEQLNPQLFKCKFADVARNSKPMTLPMRLRASLRD